MPDPRLICFHKHRTSARTRFLSYGASVLSGAALPPDARLQEISGAVRPHPAQPLLALEARMGLAAGSLRADSQFHCQFELADGSIGIVLAEFTAVDPPQAAADSVGARFIAITEARSLPAAELELLRKVYEHVLG